MLTRKMRSPEIFAAELEEVNSVESFLAKSQELREWEKKSVFEVLMAIASDNRSYPWPLYSRAADLLVHLDPPCPLSCREAILRIASAHYDWSLKTLPFYLVTQFGKSNVQTVAAEIADDTDIEERVRRSAGTIGYWAKTPASYLNPGGFCGGFFGSNENSKEVPT